MGVINNVFMPRCHKRNITSKCKCWWQVFSVSWSGGGHKPLCYSFTASVLTAAEETQLQSSYCYELCKVMKSQDETMRLYSIQKRFETHFFQFYDMFPNVHVYDERGSSSSHV